MEEWTREPRTERPGGVSTRTEVEKGYLDRPALEAHTAAHSCCLPTPGGLREIYQHSRSFCASVSFSALTKFLHVILLHVDTS